MYNIQTENGGIEKALFNQIIQIMQDAPSYENLGITVLNLSPGTAKAAMNIKKEFGNTSNHAHGGYIAALADTAMGLAIATYKFTVVTMEMSINYFLPVNVGDDIIAKGYVINLGKNTAVAESQVYNSEKSLAAKSHGIFTLRQVP